MRLHELLHFFNKYNPLDDDLVLIDLCNTTLSNDELNPFEKLKKDTLERYYRGQTDIPKSRIKFLLNIDKDLFKDYLESKLPDDYLTVANDLKLNFNIRCDASFESIFNTLFEVFRGLINSIISMKQSPKISRKRQSLANIKIEDGKIFDSNTGRVISNIPSVSENEINVNQCPRYKEQLLLSYADAENISEISEEILPTLDKKYWADYERQKINYFMAKKLEKTLNEIEVKADDDIKVVKNQIISSVDDLLDDTYDNGFKKMHTITTEVTKINFSSSLISRNTDMLGSQEKKGLVHELVNDCAISWVDEK